MNDKQKTRAVIIAAVVASQILGGITVLLLLSSPGIMCAAL